MRRWLEEDLLQRFAPLFDGTRLSCAAVLSLCREELERLSPRPEEGWLAYAYGFARGGLFPEQFPIKISKKDRRVFPWRRVFRK